MKRLAALFLLICLLLALTACDRELVKDDYLSVKTHVEQSLPEPEPSQEEQPPIVSNRNELRGAVLSFIRDWTEQGTILVHDYSGDISADLAETLRYATEEEPIGAFAVDYADYELSGTARSGSIALRIVFRRSAAEVDSIVTVNGSAAAFAKMQKALMNFDTALTLRVRNYEPADFAAELRDYCLEHPEQMLVLPDASAEVYPHEGETRIVELHFSYPEGRDELRRMQDSVNTILSSASSYIRTGKDDAACVNLLFRFLTGRFAYTVGSEEPAMPAYSLLCQGVAHSLSFASVFYAECRTANVECRILSGTKDGAARYWNLIALDGEYYHVDLMRAVEEGETELHLLTTKELQDEGYAWDETSHPATPEPEEQPSEASENGSTTENTAPLTESTEAPTEPPTEATTEPPSSETDETTETP